MISFYARWLVNCLVGCISLLASMWVVANEISTSLPSQPYVITSAEGTIEVYPDQARLQITITDTATTMADAKKSVDVLTEQVISAALNHGAKKSDLESSQVFASRHEEWQNNKQVYIGERVQRSVTILTRDLSQYSGMMEAIISLPKPSKYREVRIDQSLFEFQDQSAVENKALQQALVNAKNKAELMAESLNASLGRVYRISNAGLSIQPLLTYSADRSAMSKRLYSSAEKSASISDGELLVGKQKVTQSVQVVFIMVPK